MRWASACIANDGADWSAGLCGNDNFLIAKGKARQESVQGPTRTPFSSLNRDTLKWRDGSGVGPPVMGAKCQPAQWRQAVRYGQPLQFNGEGDGM